MIYYIFKGFRKWNFEILLPELKVFVFSHPHFGVLAQLVQSTTLTG